MSDHEDNAQLDTGVTTVSEQDRKLLAAFKSLKEKPDNIESSEDLVKFMTAYSATEGQTATSQTMRPEPEVRTTMVNLQHPRISTFWGESGKGEVNWDCFKFEVEALLIDGIYSSEQIAQGIRRAVRGEVAEILRRLGPGASVREIMCKLESTYGNIDTAESIMKKFYGCSQQLSENVIEFASRLENYFDRATQLGCLEKSDTHILKGVYYQGLRKDLKQLSAYKCDTIKDYDRFKIELRRIEAEQKESGVTKPCRPTTQPGPSMEKEAQPQSEMKEVKDLLQQLNDRIRKLEGKESASEQEKVWRPPAYRGRRGANRGYRGGPQSRGGHQPSRPIGSTTFGPTCWGCNRKGHTVANCPN